MIISEQKTDKEITWMINENNPKSFALYRNGSLVDSGELVTVNGTANYTRQMDDLVIGLYEYVLTVEDQLNLTHSLTTYVKVIDNTASEISRIGNYYTVAGNPNATITWEASDSNPGTYTITVNGELLADENWNGENIHLSMTGWAAGNYTVVLQVEDTMGNIATDEVAVHIAEGDAGTPAPGFGFEMILLAAVLLGMKKCLIDLRKRKR